MSSDLNLRARLTLDPRQWGSGLRTAGGQVKTFAAGVRREIGALQQFMQSTAGRVAGLAGGVTLAGEAMRSARMDKTLTQLGLTAGASERQVNGLRRELFGMARESGAAVDGLQQGMSALIAGGMSLKASEHTLRGINKALPVTGAQAETLAGALGVASTAFQFDLESPGKALLLLDKMTVAGRHGNAELENLSSIFARVGVNGAAAGFTFDQTLAFVEGLSYIERQPERLATLADSTLRLFTNAKYRKDAQAATGVKFFDRDGSRRDPLVVLAEIKKRMDRMRTDAERENFLTKAFGEADLDTIKGMRTLLSGDMLGKVDEITRDIAGAGGTIERDLPRALANSVDQAGRLKATLIEAADGFGRRLNGALTVGIKKLLDPKEQGGLGMSGGQLLAAGGGGLLAAYAGGRVLKGAAGRLLGGTAGLATGVAMGQALDKAGAATPVFVVGAAPGVFGGAGGGLPGTLGGAAGGAAAGTAARRLPWWRALGARAALAGGSSVGSLAGAGAGGAATVGGSVLAAGLAGWGMGSLANMGINSNRYTHAGFRSLAEPGMRNLMYASAALGSKDARAGVSGEYAAGRGMTHGQMAMGAMSGSFIGMLAQVLMRANSERKAAAEQRAKLDATVNVRVTDTRTTATVGRLDYTGGAVAVRSSIGPPVGRMMAGGGR